METRNLVNDYLRRKLNDCSRSIVLPEWCLKIDKKPNPRVTEPLWCLCQEFRYQFSDSFDLMIGELKLSHDKNTANSDFYTVASELFSEGVKWSHIVALFVFSGELAVAYGDRMWIDLLDPLSDWVTSYIDTHLYSWITEHGDWVGILNYESGRSNDFRENPWPRLKNLVCGLAAGAIGILTLRAIMHK